MLLGASVLYLAAARAGRGLVYGYGRYIHLTPERLDRAERWLDRHGTGAIVLGRLTPGLRMATVIGCGIFGVPFWRFLPSLALGSFVYILLYTLLGYFVGPTVLQLLEGIHLLQLMLGAAITHVRRNEPPMIAVTLVLFVLAAFVAWGRFGPAPFTSWRSGAENHDAIQVRSTALSRNVAYRQRIPPSTMIS